MTTEPIRLPTNVVPTLYTLHYTKIDLNNFTFGGIAKITLNISGETDTITFHSKELYLHDFNLDQNGSNIQPVSFTFNLKRQTCRLIFGQKLQVGTAILTIHFNAPISEILNGFYKSKYTFKGEDHWIASTQFESTFARRAFPCWDEPSMKAQFDIIMTVDTKYNVLSNMNAIRVNHIDRNVKEVHFARSPIMSTYLLAFVVSDFDVVTGYTINNVQVNFYCPPGQTEKAIFPLDVAIKSLEFYEEIFGIRYPLPKLDNIALPDFDAGAMENWGLITYREVQSLVHKDTSVSRKRINALTVAHEIAHMWFGDLVTMEWWTHLWLNEGFASFMEYLCVDHIFPEWNIWQLFTSSDVETALDLDGLVNTHKIEVEVNDPEEINEIFDSISYSKGSAVIMMMYRYIGHENFKNGMKKYLETYKYTNTITNNLWESLDSVSDKKVKDFMNMYTSLPGFPLITVTLENGKLYCSQKRYLSNKESKVEDSTWIIPIKATVIKGENVSYVSLPLLTEQKTCESSDFFKALNSIDGIIKLNSNVDSIIRVNYPMEMWNSFKPLIEKNILPPIDRANLLFDIFALLNSGDIDLQTVLEFVKSYKNDDDFYIWKQVASNLSSLASLYRDQPIYPKYQLFISDLFEEIYHKVGWDAKADESDILIDARPSILSIYINVGGSKEGKAEAIKRFNLYIDDPIKNPIDPNFQSLCFAQAVRQDDKNESRIAFEKLKRLYHNENTPKEEKLKCLSGMSSSDNTELLLESLNHGFDNNQVNIGDFYLPFVYCAINYYGRETAWNFLKSNFIEIEKRYHTSMNMTSYMIETSIGSFQDQSIIDDARQFFSDKDVSSFSRSLEQAIEAVMNKLVRLKRELPMFIKYFGN